MILQHAQKEVLNRASRFRRDCPNGEQNTLLTCTGPEIVVESTVEGVVNCVLGMFVAGDWIWMI